MTVTGDVGVAPGDVAAPVVQARALLDESERLWSADVRAAVHATPSPGEQHRRRLVLDALTAYERLRLAQAPSSDPATVFLRWPACTVVALANDDLTPMEYATTDIAADRWLAGWTQARAKLGFTAPSPGVAQDPVLALDPERGALVITFATTPGTTVTAAGGRSCVPDGDRWVVARATPAVTCESGGDAHRLRVVDMADPLLLFTPDGTLLPLDRPLPPGEAWIVHYGRPAEGWCEGEAQILEHRPPPVGWSRWWLARVDLAAAPAVRSAVGHGSGPRFGRWHVVTVGDRAGSAVLEFAPALAGATGPEGEPVYASPPRLVLTGGSARWTVSVGAVGSAEASSVSARGDETIVLGEGLPRPLLGRYQVRAAGGGKPVVATFTVAENVELAPSCRVRVLSPGGGLYSARITVSTPSGVCARPAVVKVGAHERDGALALHYGGRTLELRVALPHCAVRERSAAGSGPWQITSRTVDLADVTGGRWLDVHLPASLRQALASPPMLVALDRSGSEVQRVLGGRVARTDVERFRLDQLADTVRRHGDLRLRLDLPGQKTFVATVTGPRPVEPDRIPHAETARPRPTTATIVAVRHESAAVIHSGLAARDLRRVADPVAVRAMWGTAPLRALILTSPLLPYLADTERWDLAELDDDERLLLGEAAARCSAPALAVLAGAPLVPEVRTIDALCIDGRTLAEPHRLELGSADAELIALCRAVIPPDLMVVSDAPLVCALLARAAAHGDRAAAAVEQRIRPAWLRMAQRAPNLIGNDLVIAEFLITRPRPAAVGPARRVP